MWNLIKSFTEIQINYVHGIPLIQQGSHLEKRVERMPKKKKKSTDGLNSRTQDQGEESREESNAKLKRSFGDAFIVISDSDGEQESKEEYDLQKKRTKQQLDRAKFAAKRKIAQMTEDEQFALALKMSEQEARQLNSQEEEEEELLRKAIAESLSSCQPCDSAAAAALPPPAQAPESPVPSHPPGPEASEFLTAPPPHSESLCSKGGSLLPSRKANENGQTDVAKRPLVVLTRLSQEIVESSLVSSITVSPGKSQPERSTEGSSSPASSDSSDTPPCLQDFFASSPTFPRRPLGAWPLAPRQLFAGGCSPSKPASQDIENHSQNCSERDPVPGCSEPLAILPQKHSTLAHYTGPDSELEQQIQPWEKVGPSAESQKGTELPGNAPPPCTLPLADEEYNRDTVHYYWGVPFCPKGADPNKYTQVILCQLEVYQKTLKQAQRQLLQKKRFGEPVVPNSCSLSQSEHGTEEEKHFKGKGGTDEQESEDMDDEKEPESIAWLLSPANGELDKNPKQNAAKEENSEHGDDPVSSSCQASQVLFAEDVLEEGEPMQITQSISALTPLDSRRSPDGVAENCAEEEITVCPETQQSPSQAIEPESREIHSSSKDASLQADADEDAGKSMTAPSLPADGAVSCPLCDRKFPILEIERHAMYCNGTGEDTEDDAPVMTRRQREAKNRAAWGKETSQSVDNGKYEKCYVCKSLVPLKEYQSHVDSCLQTQKCSKTQGGRRLWRAKDDGRSEGRLLNLLEQSEHRAADAKTTGATPSGEDSSQRKQHPALLQVTTFQILKEGYHVPSQPPFLQAEHSQVPQPIFIGLGPLAPDHLRRSPLYPFNFIYVLLEVRLPELHTVLQVWSGQYSPSIYPSEHHGEPYQKLY
ncbi:BRCA1-A complex subunit RAP80 isoform X3 [Paroedura picta]|uniref:BRCA1-A complex subunit RAP80 isoform X3 n=1 Tax=Paroedura picta TaxID=143630 RepID=UPI0040572376